VILRPGDPLLLPANPLFIGISLLAALAINLLPLGRQPGWPDVLALVLVFWNVHQPRRVGVVIAFAFGLVMDVHQGAVLGQHALAYTLLSFGAVTIHRRVLWFGLLSQVLHVLPLFLLAQLVTVLVRLAVGGMLPHWSLWLAPLAQAALWPLAHLVLLAPQRRPPDPDQNRPL
jgi:rod shape-determining protein MreD